MLTVSTNSFPRDRIPTLYDKLEVDVQVEIVTSDAAVSGLINNWQSLLALICTCSDQTDNDHLLLEDLNFKVDSKLVHLELWDTSLHLNFDDKKPIPPSGTVSKQELKK